MPVLPFARVESAHGDLSLLDIPVDQPVEKLLRRSAVLRMQHILHLCQTHAVMHNGISIQRAEYLFSHIVDPRRHAGGFEGHFQVFLALFGAEFRLFGGGHIVREQHMPYDRPLLIPDRNNLGLINDGIRIAGRKILAVHPLEIVFELQHDILAGADLRLQLLIDIRTVE